METLNTGYWIQINSFFTGCSQFRLIRTLALTIQINLYLGAHNSDQFVLWALTIQIKSYFGRSPFRSICAGRAQTITSLKSHRINVHCFHDNFKSTCNLFDRFCRSKKRIIEKKIVQTSMKVSQKRAKAGADTRFLYGGCEILERENGEIFYLNYLFDIRSDSSVLS